MNRSKSKVSFFLDEVSLVLPQRTILKRFIETIFKKEKRKLESINYVFCKDKKLLEINKEFLGHDFYTDIVSFELSASYQPLTAEIYISVDRVRENAKKLGEPFGKEIKRVIFHGSLHLCGFKDKSKAEQLIMRAKENEYLSLFESFT